MTEGLELRDHRRTRADAHGRVLARLGFHDLVARQFAATSEGESV